MRKPEIFYLIFYLKVSVLLLFTLYFPFYCLFSDLFVTNHLIERQYFVQYHFIQTQYFISTFLLIVILLFLNKVNKLVRNIHCSNIWGL